MGKCATRNYGVVVNEIERLDETIRSLVYDSKEGLWAISAERKFTLDKATLPHQMVDAFMNAVVFVFSVDPLTSLPAKGIDVLRWPNLRMCGRPLSPDAHYFEEVRLHMGSIPTSRFKAILAPAHLVSAVEFCFKDTLVIPVNPCWQIIESDPIELFFSQTKLFDDPIRAITGSVEFSLEGTRLFGPNYEPALHAALASAPELVHFGIHTTRLPLLYRSDKTLSLEDNAKHYLKHYGRAILYHDALTEEQTKAISALPDVHVHRGVSRKELHRFFSTAPASQHKEVLRILQATTSCGH